MVAAKRNMIIGLFIMALAGLWGCSDSQPSPVAATRIKHLQQQNSKLEQDYRTTVAEVTTLRKQLATLTQESEQLKLANLQQIESLTKERDELKQRVTQAVSERENLHGHLMRFSKDLQSLAVKIEQTAANRDGQAIFSTASMHQPK